MLANTRKITCVFSIALICTTSALAQQSDSLLSPNSLLNIDSEALKKLREKQEEAVRKQRERIVVERSALDNPTNSPFALSVGSRDDALKKLENLRDELPALEKEVFVKSVISGFATPNAINELKDSDKGIGQSKSMFIDSNERQLTTMNEATATRLIRELAVQSGMKDGGAAMLYGRGKTHNLEIEQSRMQLSGLNQIISDANVELKTFNVDNLNSANPLGLTFDYKKDFAKRSTDENEDVSKSWAATLAAKGNYAFDQRVNPTDFLDAKFSFSKEWKWGGEIKGDQNGDIRGLNAVEAGVLENKIGHLYDAVNSSGDPFALVPQAGQPREVFREIADILRNKKSNEGAARVYLDGGVEANQTFSRKQYTYGVGGKLDLKFWSDTNKWSKLNLLDYPFALTRAATESTKPATPDGGAFPIFDVGIDSVMPADGDPRSMVGDRSNYPRFKAVVNFRTTMIRLGGGDIDFSAEARFYQELGASAAVRGAGLDQYTYFGMTISIPDGEGLGKLAKGAFVSYGTGKVPLDDRSETVVQVGWNYDFD